MHDIRTLKVIGTNNQLLFAYRQKLRYFLFHSIDLKSTKVSKILLFIQELQQFVTHWYMPVHDYQR